MSSIPYKSEKQRRFMESQHPEIARRWRKKGHAYVQKDASGKGGWAKPLAIGIGGSVVGGAVANQIPAVRIDRKKKKVRIKATPNDPRAKIQFEKKGKISKLLVPPHDDPFFNQAAAQKMFDLVMKMDDDTAEVFCYVVASDLLEQEVEKNRVTLQKHLDEVIEKRLTDLKKATLRAVSKGMDNPVPYAQALAMFESLIKKDDDEIPNWEFERKIKRDPSTGRFRIKFTDQPLPKPMPEKTAEAMKIEGVKASKYKNLSAKDKARYQHQYLQIANYLDAVNASTGGDHQTLVHFKNDRTGETWAERSVSTKPMTTMMDKDVRAIAAETVPEGLKVGGVAFSLAGATGRTMDSQSVEALNRAGDKSGQWTKDWVKDTGSQNQNARLYSRTQTLGQVASTIGPDGGKLQLAGAMAEIVGQYGPQAEEVLGPSARKTAYRYRGTERTPDKRLISMYDQAIKHNKRVGPIDPWAEREEAQLRTSRGAGKQPFGSETGVRAKSPRATGKPGVTPAITQMVADRESRDSRAPEWRERELGRAAVSQYLTEKLPSKRNYKLQLASGNTPPSEGVIINSKGQIVTQAVGYGDDHYLPFNLKNLKGLKGGEYVRNRSVGGLTSEDVYTGLISGARRVTVVSRSGTFTMEFKPDFRGGRRHNDKARRMTRRYEQILDAVQSEQVERGTVPPTWRKVIEDEVRGEYPAGTSPRLIRAEIDNRLTEFKANPQIDGRDLDRAEAAISRFEEQAKQGLVSRQDAADYRKQIHGELKELKEIHFRLNGVGYTAALDSLREQFPYYIDAAAIPKEEELEEYEHDLGYVEPARVRPTGASAGWYGTNHKVSGKFSAAHADYQRGLPGTPAPPRPYKKEGYSTGASSSTSSSSSGGGGVRSDRDKTRDKLAEALEQTEGREQVKNKSVALQQAIKNNQIAAPTNEATPAWWGLDENEMRAHLDEPGNLDRFHTWVAAKSDRLATTDVSRHLVEYQNARRRTSGGTTFEAKHANTWLAAPYKFVDNHEAYRPSPDPVAVQIEINRLDGSDVSLKHGQPLSTLTDQQLREEFELAKGMREAMRSSKTYGTPAQDAFGGRLANPGSGFASKFFSDDQGALNHLENIHRMRYLKTKRGPMPGGGSNGGAGPASASGGGGGSAPPTGPASSGVAVSPQPRGGSGGHLEAIEHTPEMDDAREVDRQRKNWVTAATRARDDATGQEWNDLDNFINGINTTKGDRNFKGHEKWLEELPEQTRTKIEENLNAAYR